MAKKPANYFLSLCLFVFICLCLNEAEAERARKELLELQAHRYVCVSMLSFK